MAGALAPQMRDRWARWDLETSLPTHPTPAHCMAGRACPIGAWREQLEPHPLHTRALLTVCSVASVSCVFLLLLHVLLLLSPPSCPSSPLQPPESQLRALIFLAGAGEAAQRGQTSFSPPQGPAQPLPCVSSQPWQPAMGEVAAQWPCPLGHRHLPQVST